MTSEALFVDFLSVPLPTPGVALAGQGAEPCDLRLRVIFSDKLSQTVPDILIEGCSRLAGLAPGLRNDAIVDGEREVHVHRICVHGFRVKCLYRVPKPVLSSGHDGQFEA